MSRRTNLLQQLVATTKSGSLEPHQEKYLAATAELILTDLINIAINGVQVYGAGTLMINLITDSTVYMSGNHIEQDLRMAESNEDEDVVTMLRSIMEQVDSNDWSKFALITIISKDGARTFNCEAGGSQESLRSLAEEFTGQT
mgnify:FL=1|jgi:hypothetical protein